MKREQADLLEYEETYKTRMEGFQREIREMEDFEKQIRKNAESIDSTLNEKDSCKDRAFQIKQEINQLKIKKDNAIANKEYTNEKLTKLDADLEELQTSVTSYEKKIGKQEQEKKKAAAAKKFKEAAKAQQEIKDLTTLLEEAQAKVAQHLQEREIIEKEMQKKDEELVQYEKLLKSN